MSDENKLTLKQSVDYGFTYVGYREDLSIYRRYFSDEYLEVTFHDGGILHDSSSSIGKISFFTFDQLKKEYCRIVTQVLQKYGFRPYLDGIGCFMVINPNDKTKPFTAICYHIDKGFQIEICGVFRQLAGVGDFYGLELFYELLTGEKITDDFSFADITGEELTSNKKI